MAKRGIGTAFVNGDRASGSVGAVAIVETLTVRRRGRR